MTTAMIDRLAALAGSLEEDDAKLVHEAMEEVSRLKTKINRLGDDAKGLAEQLEDLVGWVIKKERAGEIGIKSSDEIVDDYLVEVMMDGVKEEVRSVAVEVIHSPAASVPVGSTGSGIEEDEDEEEEETESDEDDLDRVPPAPEERPEDKAYRFGWDDDDDIEDGQAVVPSVAPPAAPVRVEGVVIGRNAKDVGKALASLFEKEE